MDVYSVMTAAGQRAPVFQIDVAYAGPRAIAKILSTVGGVSEIATRRFIVSPRDIHIRFLFRGVPFVVLEPWGDNSRYWIGPADIADETLALPREVVADEIVDLETAFRAYQPSAIRQFIGDILTLKFLKSHHQRG